MQPNQKLYLILLIVAATIAITFGQTEVVCPPSQDGFPVFIPNKFGKKYIPIDSTHIEIYSNSFYISCRL